VNAEGKKVNRKAVIGTVKQYKTEAAAWKAAEPFRLTINNETPQAVMRPVTVEQLVLHYIDKELPVENSKKAYSTSEAYKSYFNNWVLPRWKAYRIQDVKAIAVEEWLGNLAIANGTKSKIRNIMSALFKHASRHEWIVKNPISNVRQSAKREKVPEVLDVEEIRSLIERLKEPYRTMVFLAAASGLRAGELLALKWSDVDLESLEINLNRAIVQQVVGALKTEASGKSIPLAPELAEALLNWKLMSAYGQEGDWVFASPEKRGTQPYWPENPMRRHIRPAAKLCGIEKQIGWHTFRHSYAMVLKGRRKHQRNG
jgi:integrase